MKNLVNAPPCLPDYINNKGVLRDEGTTLRVRVSWGEVLEGLWPFTTEEEMALYLRQLVDELNEYYKSHKSRWRVKLFNLGGKVVFEGINSSGNRLINTEGYLVAAHLDTEFQGRRYWDG